MINLLLFISFSSLESELGTWNLELNQECSTKQIVTRKAMNPEAAKAQSENGTAVLPITNHFLFLVILHSAVTGRIHRGPSPEFAHGANRSILVPSSAIRQVKFR